MRIKLNKTDKIRLAELVEAYIRLNTQFKVEDNGSVTAKIPNKNFKWMLGFGEVRDFHEITMRLIQSLMEQKAEIPAVQSFCSDAMSHLMTDNDRSSVIKCLYMAHLTDKNNDNLDGYEERPRDRKRKHEVHVDVEVQRESSPVRNHAIKVFRGILSSDHIAETLNNSGCIVVRE